MPRTPRRAPGGLAYHAMNRACTRAEMFRHAGDYAAFERVMEYALQQVPTRLLSYCLMPNHWHLVLWPEKDGELTAFLRRLTHTHAQRWHAARHTAGTGHLYQGRFRSFPIQQDDHLLRVIRYVERNPLRANLVRRAEHWRWGSLWRRERGSPQEKQILSDWPVERPEDWLEWVNEAGTEAELEALRRSLNRGCPYGREDWRQRTATELGLGRTLRPPGRPPKPKAVKPPKAEPPEPSDPTTAAGPEGPSEPQAEED